jgi:anti-sigma factor RsiW
MPEARVERRLAAILAADVAGYSRLMGTDEVSTLAALKALRREIVDPAIAVDAVPARLRFRRKWRNERPRPRHVTQARGLGWPRAGFLRLLCGHVSPPLGGGFDVKPEVTSSQCSSLLLLLRITPGARR